MYGGRMMGGGYPWAGLGDWLDDIQNAVTKAQVVKGEVEDITHGRTELATIPTDRPTITFPTGKGVGLTIGIMPLVLGAAALLYLGIARRGRR